MNTSAEAIPLLPTYGIAILVLGSLIASAILIVSLILLAVYSLQKSRRYRRTKKCVANVQYNVARERVMLTNSTSTGGSPSQIDLHPSLQQPDQTSSHYESQAETDIPVTLEPLTQYDEWIGRAAPPPGYECVTRHDSTTSYTFSRCFTVSVNPLQASPSCHSHPQSGYDTITRHVLTTLSAATEEDTDVDDNYTHVLTDHVSDWVYSVVPSSQERLLAQRGEGIDPENVCEFVNAERLYENTSFIPPAKHLADLYNQLAGTGCIEIPKPVVKLECGLGEGQFGEVRKGLWETPYGNIEVAVKALKNYGDEEIVKFLQEAVIMGQFRHPHIVRMLGAITLDDPIMLVLEFLSNGDLLTWLSNQRKEIEFVDLATFPSLLLQFCSEITGGLVYLSGKNFVHRDLAARNILLDSGLHCKIADFGLARDLSYDPYYISSGKKIPIRWTSPEALFYKRYSPASDVWSYGMLMFEIWSLGRQPFPGMSAKEVVLILKKKEGYVQAPPPGCPRLVYHVMVLCWQPDYNKRVAFSDIKDCLQDPDMLDIPSEGLVHLRDPHRAISLGAPITVSKGMYKDLQNIYFTDT